MFIYANTDCERKQTVGSFSLFLLLVILCTTILLPVFASDADATLERGSFGVRQTVKFDDDGRDIWLKPTTECNPFIWQNFSKVFREKNLCEPEPIVHKVYMEDGCNYLYRIYDLIWKEAFKRYNDSHRSDCD